MPVASKDSDSDEIAAYTGGGQHIKIERPPVRIEKNWLWRMQRQKFAMRLA
jgi:hypothetical protein